MKIITKLKFVGNESLAITLIQSKVTTIVRKSNTKCTLENEFDLKNINEVPCRQEEQYM